MSTGREQTSQICMVGSLTQRPTKWIFWSHCRSSPDRSTTLIAAFFEPVALEVTDGVLTLVLVPVMMAVSSANHGEYNIQSHVPGVDAHQLERRTNLSLVLVVEPSVLCSDHRAAWGRYVYALIPLDRPSPLDLHSFSWSRLHTVKGRDGCGAHFKESL